MDSPTILAAKGLYKTYRRKQGPEVAVLSGVDLDIRAGDRIAILGKSGAGKSTLLHVIGTLERPSSGRISFAGKDILTLSESELSFFRNQRLGFVFQFHYLMLEFTALENVMMPVLISGRSTREARERAEELLVKVGLQDRMHHRPSQLSGGEQSRVAIARSLANRPKLLFTDEMTGNLDATTGRKVFDLVQSLYEEFKMALVSVTHDETLAQEYQRVIRLESGKLHILKG